MSKMLNKQIADLQEKYKDLTEEEQNRYKTTIAELEKKENELAKEIAYKIYRGEVIVLDTF